jgi:hypothetical protein
VVAFYPQLTGGRSERIAAVVFGIYLVLAVPILVHLGSHYWFMGDEWAFLVGGSITDPTLLFRPIQSHWSTLPILVYRALYGVFGLHSYLPFQLCVILLHLALCCLLRAIMRRVGVGPWTATICAAVFVLFGPGYQNILRGVQISQVGSIVLGFTCLLLADHDGGIARRDRLGLLCGLGSIISSGLGPPMVAIVGLAVLCRRGWRPALFHTLPLAAIYVAWWIASHTTAPAEQPLPPLAIFAQWLAYSQSGVFLALGGGYGVVAMALGTLLVTGLVLAWMPLSLPVLRQRASLPAAMLVGALALQVVICAERWNMMWIMGFDAALVSRYLHVYTALTLPALAVAADSVVRRWPRMMPPVFALFLAGIGVNTTQFGKDPLHFPTVHSDSRAALLALAYSPLAEQAPANLMPEPNGLTGGDVDVAFLIAARDAGNLPPPPAMTDDLASRTELRLSVQQLSGPIPESLTCAVYTGSVERNPGIGDLFGFTTPILVSLGETGAPLAYNSGWGSFLPMIRILRPHLQLRFAALPPATSFGLCHSVTD